MVSLLLLSFFIFLFWIFTRALLWVIYYLIIYLTVAHAAFLLLGNYIDFNGPVAFWLSRIIFLVLTFWLGGKLRAFLGRYPAVAWLLVIGGVALVIFMFYRPLPPEFYYYQPPLPGQLL